MKTINWHNRARKQMERIPRPFQEAIFNAVDQLVEFPNCKNMDIVSLKNHRYDYRMRVGR